MSHSKQSGLRRLPIWRDANQFLLAIEKVVKQFPRYHKYTLGTELRQNALNVCNLINQAWQNKDKPCVYLQKLKYCLDEIKIQLHSGACPRMKSLLRKRDFEHLFRLFSLNRVTIRLK